MGGRQQELDKCLCRVGFRNQTAIGNVPLEVMAASRLTRWLNRILYHWLPWRVESDGDASDGSSCALKLMNASLFKPPERMSCRPPNLCQRTEFNSAAPLCFLQSPSPASIDGLSQCRHFDVIDRRAVRIPRIFPATICLLLSRRLQLHNHICCVPLSMGFDCLSITLPLNPPPIARTIHQMSPSSVLCGANSVVKANQKKAFDFAASNHPKSGCLSHEHAWSVPSAKPNSRYRLFP